MAARWIDIAEVPVRLAPGMRVYVGGSSNEPTSLLDAIAAAPTHAAGVTFVQFPLAGLNNHDPSSWHPDARVECFFMAPQLANGLAQGRVAFLPMQMRAVYDYVGGQAFDVALLQLGYGRDGRLRLGPNVDFAAAALAGARACIAEVNTAVVAPAGCPTVDESRFDALVRTHRPLRPFDGGKPDAVANEIARHVAALVRDGDCIQTGIGAIPAAILAALADKNDLGLHSGLIDDGGMALIQRGVMTGLTKPIDRGLHVTGMALGSAALLDWLADRQDVAFRGADHTHEVGVIRQIPGFVSINSAVEVDLFGQINAERVGGKQISGTGGSVDFMRAAKASKGGRSIVAMTATARGGQVSRIVARVELATALRTDVDLVVTEYGVAALKQAPVQARAEALIAIAAPQFRDELATRWRESQRGG
ncbi:MAG TPA: acetyl-CoA hydrolase/transferase C-terminal domain-containing protein [Pseudomonadales bacterium]|nr:acetyl-CoA hydrolase/transferase C-terminal domain-containing protein [Pseudomonadales bacterium]